MALEKLETPDTAGGAPTAPDRGRLAGGIVIVWLALLVAGLGASPLVTEPVLLGDGWPTYTAAIEASLRWHVGHVPHLDYHTPIGAAYWLQQGLAVEAIGFTPKSGLAANLIAGVVLVLVGLFLLRPRLGPLGTAVLMTGVVLLVLSLRPFGAGAGTIGDIASPERTGLAITAILLAGFFLEPRRKRRPLAEALESLVVAGLLVWLVYLDAYLAALVLLGGGAAMAFPTASRGLILEATSFAALACIAIGLIFGVGFPYLADIEPAIAAAPVVQLGNVAGDIQGNIVPLVAVFAAFGLYLFLERARSPNRADTIGITLVLLLVGVLSANRVEGGALPLLFVAPLVLAARAHASAASDNGGHAAGRWFRNGLASRVPALLVAITLVGLAGGADAISLGRSIQQGPTSVRLCAEPEIPACAIRLPGGVEAQWRTLPTPSTNAPGTASDMSKTAYTVEQLTVLCGRDADCLHNAVFADLIPLLNSVMGEGDTPLLLAATNPLPYYYSVAPPRKVMSRLVPGRTVSLKHHPSGRTLFSDASVLVVPKSDVNPTFDSDLVLWYEGDIARLYDLVAETEIWSIHRKSGVK